MQIRNEEVLSSQLFSKLPELPKFFLSIGTERLMSLSSKFMDDGQFSAVKKWMESEMKYVSSKSFNSLINNYRSVIFHNGISKFSELTTEVLRASVDFERENSSSDRPFGKMVPLLQQFGSPIVFDDLDFGLRFRAEKRKEWLKAKSEAKDKAKAREVRKATTGGFKPNNDDFFKDRSDTDKYQHLQVGDANTLVGYQEFDFSVSKLKANPLKISVGDWVMSYELPHYDPYNLAAGEGDSWLKLQREFCDYQVEAGTKKQKRYGF